MKYNSDRILVYILVYCHEIVTTPRPRPHVREPHYTVSSHRNPNPFWPETRPPTVTSARKPTNFAPKQPASLRSQDSQTDNATPKQPAPVINQSS